MDHEDTAPAADTGTEVDPPEQGPAAVRARALGAEIGSIDIAVPEWDAVVRIRGFSGADLDAWDQMVSARTASGAGLVGLRAELAVRVCRDPDTDERLFAAEDVGPLSEGPQAPLERIWKASSPLVGFGPGDEGGPADEGK